MFEVVERRWKNLLTESTALQSCSIEKIGFLRRLWVLGFRGSPLAPRLFGLFTDSTFPGGVERSSAHPITVVVFTSLTVPLKSTTITVQLNELIAILSGWDVLLLRALACTYGRHDNPFN